jgi:predicted transcriptional regulator
MKAKLTITVDEELVPRAKRYAQSRGASLSQIIEDALRTASSSDKVATFSQRWRGRFQPAERKSERYKRLAKKYL